MPVRYRSPIVRRIYAACEDELKPSWRDRAISAEVPERQARSRPQQAGDCKQAESGYQATFDRAVYIADNSCPFPTNGLTGLIS